MTHTSRRPSWRALFIAAALCVLPAMLAVPNAPAEAVPAPPAGWNLVWGDDFDGAANTGVDTGNWRYATGTGYPGGAPNWGTGEIETMTSSTNNVYRDGAGHLVIKPLRDGAGNWTSGRVETQRTDFAAPAGGKLRIEGSLQQPNVSGAAAAGYWPAFWTLGDAARPASATNWPSIGEIDLMEAINGRGTHFATRTAPRLTVPGCKSGIAMDRARRSSRSMVAAPLLDLAASASTSPETTTAATARPSCCGTASHPRSTSIGIATATAPCVLSAAASTSPPQAPPTAPKSSSGTATAPVLKPGSSKPMARCATRNPVAASTLLTAPRLTVPGCKSGTVTDPAHKNSP